jgi:hypothetical protein
VICVQIKRWLSMRLVPVFLHCRLAGLGARRPAEHLPAPAGALWLPVATQAVLPPLVRAGCLVLGPAQGIARTPVPLQAGTLSSGTNTSQQLLFSFTAENASVPAAQQTIGYRLLR